MSAVLALLALALLTALPLGLAIASDAASAFPRRAVIPAATIAGIAAAIGLAIPRGPLALGLVVPWIGVVSVVAGAALLAFIRTARDRAWADVPQRIGIGVAIAFLGVGCVWLAFDRLGVRPLGFAETIVLLTAVHFHVAGFCLTLAGVLAASRGGTPPRAARIAAIATAALIAGMPLTAAGFLGVPVAAWIGAVLVAAAGLGIGAATVAAATRQRGTARTLLMVAGLTLFVTMPLAAAYATGSTFHIAVLDVPAMAAIHGGLNVIGFAIPAMLGWWLADR